MKTNHCEIKSGNAYVPTSCTQILKMIIITITRDKIKNIATIIGSCDDQFAHDWTFQVRGNCNEQRSNPNRRSNYMFQREYFRVHARCPEGIVITLHSFWTVSMRGNFTFLPRNFFVILFHRGGKNIVALPSLQVISPRNKFQRRCLPDTRA